MQRETNETEMGGLFQRQLAVYVEYHRDPRNTAMHVVGILLLFTGAVMPGPPTTRRKGISALINPSDAVTVIQADPDLPATGRI